jgi:hypothetical protein
MEKQARIIINRSSEWMNRVRAFKVFIDGEQVGTIKNGGAEEFKIDPGVHTVVCKVDWCSSQELGIVVSDGETEYLKVSNGMKYYYYLVIPMVVVLAYNFYIVMARAARPIWFSWVMALTVLPVLTYLFYYLTVGRKSYLLLQKDEKGFLG